MSVSIQISAFLAEIEGKTLYYLGHTVANTLTDYLVRFNWPWEKSKEKEKAIATTQDRRENGQIYYHVTTVTNATIIATTGILRGSSGEGGHVFAFGIMPTKKAIKNSGAMHSEVIVKFETNASFEKDPGIEDSYVLKFSPKRSTLRGPIHVTNVNILPIL